MNKNLPAEWELATLGDIAEVDMGQSPPGETYNNKGNGLPLLNGPAEFRNQFPVAVQWTTKPMRLAHQGDILFCVRGNTTGRTNIADKTYCIGRGLAAIRAKNGSNTAFILSLLSHTQKSIYNRALGGGSTFPNISRAELLDLVVPKPPPCEQRKIAAVLSLVQRTIEQQDRLLALIAELKKALLHKLFTEGLHGEPQKQTETGLVPQSWTVLKLSSIARLQTGGTPSREEPQFWEDGTIPWVKTTEIDYRVISATEEKITRAGLQNSAAKIFPAGTLLIAMYGQGVTRGRVAILGIDAATNQACAAITPLDERTVSTRFLYYFLQYHYETVREMGHGANQKNLNMALLGGFTITYPKLYHQAQIVNILEAVDQKMLLLEKRHAALQDLFRTLLHQLMTAQIRVNHLDLSEEDFS